MAKRIKSIKDLPPDFKVIHELADGTIVDSIKGKVVPYTPETHMYYEILAKYSVDNNKKQ